MALFPTSRAAFTVPPLPDLSLERKWQQEIETLGLVLSVHPLTMWQPVIRTLPYSPGSGIKTCTACWTAGLGTGLAHYPQGSDDQRGRTDGILFLRRPDGHL